MLKAILKLKSFGVGNNRNKRKEQMELPPLALFPREGKGVPDFDLTPSFHLVLHACACSFMSEDLITVSGTPGTSPTCEDL